MIKINLSQSSLQTKTYKTIHVLYLTLVPKQKRSQTQKYSMNTILNNFLTKKIYYELIRVMKILSW